MIIIAGAVIITLTETKIILFIIYYFYPIDRIYLLAESSSKIEYISKEENEELYKYAEKKSK